MNDEQLRAEFEAYEDRLIAAFSDHKHAMEVQRLLCEANRGNSYTVMWCDGYHTSQFMEANQ